MIANILDLMGLTIGHSANSLDLRQLRQKCPPKAIKYFSWSSPNLIWILITKLTEMI